MKLPKGRHQSCAMTLKGCHDSLDMDMMCVCRRVWNSHVSKGIMMKQREALEMAAQLVLYLYGFRVHDKHVLHHHC